MPTKLFFNWSSGKDSALALYRLQQDPSYVISRLLTTINASYQRVSMHGLRKELLLQQLHSLGYPYQLIELPDEPSMKAYEETMNGAVLNMNNLGLTHAGFGDIYLEDLREYREKQLSAVGIEAIFPLWGGNTHAMLKEFITLGFKAITVCIDNSVLSKDWLGRELNEDFVKDLPSNVDPCGENGEFHTFCYDGPIFTHPIPFTIGEKVYREYQSPNQPKNAGFWFCDLLPVSA